ncbi:MAG: peptidylprolyl isomerase [Flavobacteriaceae bacterium]|nr:MAG: peptidylprolyl isomerase [Flavobacteriaceae bacterium]
MQFLKRDRHRSVLFFLSIFLMVCLLSCDSFFRKKEVREPLARVGDVYLFKEDVQLLLNNNMSKGDSASFVTNYINTWAVKQLMMSKAKINLPEDKLAEYDQLVNDYRSDLYTRAYKEALVQLSPDSVINTADLNGFYEKEKENFKLKEKIVTLRFIELPLQFMNKGEVIKRLKDFKEADVAYLDSIGVQFKKLHFNDSLWIPSSRVIDEIPSLTYENERRYLKKSQFFELQDSLGVYLAMVTDILEVNDIAPLQYIEPTIRQVLSNRRKLQYGRKLETEIIDEAIKKNEFEVYEKNK